MWTLQRLLQLSAADIHELVGTKLDADLMLDAVQELREFKVWPGPLVMLAYLLCLLGYGWLCRHASLLFTNLLGLLRKVYALPSAQSCGKSHPSGDIGFSRPTSRCDQDVFSGHANEDHAEVCKCRTSAEQPTGQSINSRCRLLLTNRLALEFSWPSTITMCCQRAHQHQHILCHRLDHHAQVQENCKQKAPAGVQKQAEASMFLLAHQSYVHLCSQAGKAA